MPYCVEIENEDLCWTAYSLIRSNEIINYANVKMNDQHTMNDLRRRVVLNSTGKTGQRPKTSHKSKDHSISRTEYIRTSLPLPACLSVFFVVIVIVAYLTVFNYVTNSVLRSEKKQPNDGYIQHTLLRKQQNSNTSIGIQHQYENKFKPKAKDYTIKNAASEIKEQPKAFDKKPSAESHDEVKERPETTNQSNPNKSSKPAISLPNVILIEAGTSSVRELKD